MPRRIDPTRYNWPRRRQMNLEHLIQARRAASEADRAGQVAALAFCKLMRKGVTVCWDHGGHQRTGRVLEVHVFTSWECQTVRVMTPSGAVVDVPAASVLRAI